MSPKEKAYELIGKFIPYCENYVYPKSNQEGEFKNNPQFENAKKCAIIAVTEMLAITPMYTGNLNPKWDYYDKVKKELELL